MRPLVHIGYHKTGTTFLQRRFFNDKKSGLALAAGPPNTYEVLNENFIDVNPFEFDPVVARSSLEPAIKNAQNRKLIPIISHERFSGSPFAGGYDSKEMADRLAATLPEARILAVIREQSSMLLSLYKLYVRQGGAMPLHQFVDSETGRIRVPGFRFDFLEYHRLIGHHVKLFGGENVLVLPYEMLKGDPARFFGRIGEFLEVRVSPPEQKSVNVSASALALSVKRQINRHFIRDNLNPAPAFAPRFSNIELMRGIVRLDSRLPTAMQDAQERRWSSFVQEYVGERYSESNALTAEITGLHLEEFGYPCKR
jgi:hypothetical protein